MTTALQAYRAMIRPAAQLCRTCQRRPATVAGYCSNQCAYDYADAVRKPLPSRNVVAGS